MNRQVDIIIIGDSKHGNETVKALASVKPTLKIAFISSTFNSKTTHDFINVEYVKEEVVFTDYKNRLFGCYLKNGDRFYCTHLIIASGVKYKPFMIGTKKVPNVYNNLDDLPKHSKDLPAVVIGKDNSDIKFALAVAKKFKYVYLCTKQITISGITTTNYKKLNETENLVLLQNTGIERAILSNGALKSVELDNYSVLMCSAIFVKTEATPETSFVSNKLISKNENGLLETNANAESTLVPKLFAVGNCCKKHTKKMQQQMIASILEDFKGV